jgi:serine/threonine protein phosphatase 1
MKLNVKNIQNTYVIGDVHGCFHTLEKLLAKLPVDAQVIFVGDLCDRGLHTKEVIDLIIQNNYYSILGNHDDYMVAHLQECMDNKDLCVRWNIQEYMGGEQTLKSYENEYETMTRHLEFLQELPRYIEIDKYFITHGFSLPYYKRRDKSEAQTGLLKNRISDEKKWGHEWEKAWQDYDVVNIFGHTHYDEVKVGKNYYGIDTGCVYGNKLTAIQLGSMDVIDEALDSRDV